MVRNSGQSVTRIDSRLSRERRLVMRRFITVLVQVLFSENARTERSVNCCQYSPCSLSVHISVDALSEILPDPVQLLWGFHCKERQFVHVALDETILRIGWENAVDEALVAWSQRRAASAAGCKSEWPAFV